MRTMWTDTHCHFDAREFGADHDAVAARARAAGVDQVVIPAVMPANFDAVRTLAHRHGLSYALGIHPLCVDAATDANLDSVRGALEANRDDPRLVALGEIGIDHFVPGLDRPKQERFLAAQLALAREFGLPVILHVRRSSDTVLKHLRRTPVPGGIAHAFNGSEQQALGFVGLGLKLGFGGAMTFERALQIRRLATTLPEAAIVLETDAPDIPPQWLYRKAADRGDGAPGARNESSELPRIGATLAALRGCSADDVARFTSSNARAALPRLRSLDAA